MKRASTEEKGLDAIRDEHTFIETWHEQQANHCSNLVAELSGLRLGTMLLTLCAMALTCLSLQLWTAGFRDVHYSWNKTAEPEHYNRTNKMKLVPAHEDPYNESAAYQALREEARDLQNISSAVENENAIDEEMKEMLSELEHTLA